MTSWIDERFAFGMKHYKEIAEKLCGRYKIKDEDVYCFEDECQVYWKDIHVTIVEIIICPSELKIFTPTGTYIVSVTEKDRYVYSAGMFCEQPITWKKLVEVLDTYLPRKAVTQERMELDDD